MNEIYHYGIPGMKWGVRRYENPDGTLTEAGKKRYSSEARKSFNKAKVSPFSNKQTKSFGQHTDKVVAAYKKEANKSPYEKKLTEMDKKGVELNKKYKGRFNDPHVKSLVREWNREYYDTAAKNTEYGKKVAEKYIVEFNKALVEDLNIPNSDEVAKYITDNQPLWDATYISNYAWFNKLF